MFEFRKRTLPIAIDKELEYLKAQAETAKQNAANVDYLAMMANVDLYVGEDDVNE